MYGLIFVIVADLTSPTLSVTRGPETGGTLVTLTGSNFVSIPTLTVRFGSRIVYATYTSASQIAAETPANAAGLYSVAVSNNNQDFTTFAVSFTYSCTSLLRLSVVCSLICVF